MMPRLRTHCLALLAFTLGANARLGALITSPATLDLLTGQVDVQVSVELEGAGSWTLQAMQDGQDGVLLASGGGSVAPGTTVYSGSLPQGPVSLVLDVTGENASASHEVRVVATATPLNGWPFRQGELAFSSLLHPMAEGRDGGVLVARQAEGSREAVEMGELVWLDGAGAPLPGWPLPLFSLSQALSPRSEPILMRRQGEDRLAVVSKTHVLEFNRQGALEDQVACGGLPMGEAVLLHRSGAGDCLALPVLTTDGPVLRLLDAQAGTTETVELPGTPLWSRPVLGDFTADGQVDLVVLVNGPTGPQALLIDGRTRQSSNLADLPVAQWVSASAGDLDGDFEQDLVLVARGGLVLVLNRNQELWRQELPASTLGPAALMDIEGDQRQEVALLAQDAGGTLRLLVWDAEGGALPFSGATACTQGSAVHPPQLVRDEGGVPHLLLAVEAGGGAWASCVLDMDLQGQVMDRGWWLPTAFSGTPRLLDVDGNGTLEVVAGDERGRWVAWPAGWQDVHPPHPRGDARHGGLTLQPVGPGVMPDVLAGAMALADQLELQDDQRVEDLCLERGRLVVDTAFRPGGVLTVDSGATLGLGVNAEVIGAQAVPIRLRGRLQITGGGAGAAFMPGPSASTPANTLLSRLDVHYLPGSHVTLRQCLLHALPSALVVEACSLSLDSCWFLAGAHGLVARHAVVRATDCLFQPSENLLQILDGSRLEMDECVVTSSPATALYAHGAFVRLHNTQFLTCEEALRLEGGTVSVLDSVHFQANGRDVVLGVDHGVLDLHDCDFMESREAGLVNESGEAVVAVSCHWDADQPSLGPVIRREDRPSPVKPVVIPNPVFDVEPGPMVDGDEPLEWSPVEFSVGGIPIHVEYRVYRSLLPYDVVRPENLVAVTSTTAWRDPNHHAKCFYRVTASMGKQVVD